MKRDFKEMEKKLAYTMYQQRENGIRHHYYNEEMKQYHLMKDGNPQGVQESNTMMRKNQARVLLSNNPVHNIKYLFVTCTTIATRFAIEGGMDSETAYSISDLYIYKMDSCRTVEEVLSIHGEMFSFFTQKMTEIKNKQLYSLPVVQCIAYINEHLHEPIRLVDLADHVNLNQSYLSKLFGKETGQSLTEFIMTRKIEAAKSMLRYSEYTAAEISEILAFSSQSHFIRVFKKIEGMTPRTFALLYSQDHIDAANNMD